MQTFTFTKSFTSRVAPTENVKTVAAMFGIGIDESIDIDLYRDLAVKLGPKRVIYITGDSGAGKSCLLRDIKDAAGKHPDFALFEEDAFARFGEEPLIDQFEGWGIKEAGELLAYVGISEAFVYLRKPGELSDGQRYRFMLAKMIEAAVSCRETHTPVICIDEYLAFLDRETARNVAYQTRRAANRFGLCVCVATTHEDIAADLQPNTTITLRLNIPPQVRQRALAGA